MTLFLRHGSFGLDEQLGRTNEIGHWGPVHFILGVKGGGCGIDSLLPLYVCSYGPECGAFGSIVEANRRWEDGVNILSTKWSENTERKGFLLSGGYSPLGPITSMSSLLPCSQLFMGCGILGHILGDCSKVIDGSDFAEEGELLYGTWLRETNMVRQPFLVGRQVFGGAGGYFSDGEGIRGAGRGFGCRRGAEIFGFSRSEFECRVRGSKHDRPTEGSSVLVARKGEGCSLNPRGEGMWGKQGGRLGSTTWGEVEKGEGISLMGRRVEEASFNFAAQDSWAKMSQ
ncbi:hypothetical protein Salat_0192500 [Sesamum alatum]|uniref:Uncharacterized protein n=1 Tax=Sesamum alatum TaxID=300844 RepID=A0AAE1YXR4_9LAMI|nr:hypothetical protein Salat_0192500 [Sesamum alatum]